MYKRVACSLRVNPSKVQTFQAGQDDKDEREENVCVKKARKNRPQEFRQRQGSSPNTIYWNKDIELSSCSVVLEELNLTEDLAGEDTNVNRSASVKGEETNVNRSASVKGEETNVNRSASVKGEETNVNRSASVKETKSSGQWSLLGSPPASPIDLGIPPLLSTSRWQQPKKPDYSYGTLVWAKFIKMWWPGIVVDGFLAKVNPPKEDNLWIFWFGDNKVSEIPKSCVDLFTTRYRKRTEGKHSKLFETGISKILKVCAQRAKIEDLETDDNVRDWGRSEKGFISLAKEQPELFAPDKDSPYPAEVYSALIKIADMHSGPSDSDSDMELEMEEKKQESDFIGDMVPNKPLREPDLEGDFCLSCGKLDQGIVEQHPLFEGSICGQCKDTIMEGFFALDSDGYYLFCGICGLGGQLVLCETPDCGRSYCLACLKRYLEYTAIKKMKSSSPWACFMCTPYKVETHGLLVPWKNWQEHVLRFFNQRKPDVSKDGLLPINEEPKRKIRVLSLFDGIGTVKYVLNQLGLDVDVFYASEIDADAKMVTLYHHSVSVKQLGDVLKIGPRTLQKIAPIDLVVCTPPCDDLDITNRDRKGFNGNGTFIFKILLLLKDMEMINPDRPLFWLVETTANLKTDYRNSISNFFECLPALWDAQYFSSYLCPRYYWGNLPNMYSVIDHWEKVKIFSGTNVSLLGDFLSHNLKRTAVMSKLRSVAIDVKPHQAKQMSTNIKEDQSINYRLPAVMEERKSIVWVNEVEKVLGFTEHYTDVAKITVSQRQKLLKQASSVHILKHLLFPLTKMFAQNEITVSSEVDEMEQ